MIQLYAIFCPQLNRARGRAKSIAIYPGMSHNSGQLAIDSPQKLPGFRLSAA
jgi:hypothetical protein